MGGRGFLYLLPGKKYKGNKYLDLSWRAGWWGEEARKNVIMQE